MSNLQPVEGNLNYRKDAVRGACVNVDNQQYHTRLARLRAQKIEGARLDKLENELGEIKHLLTQLVQGK